jgi:hypothetical protein
MDVISHASRVATEAVYVTVGLGLLGVNRAQVRRRELEHEVQRTVRGAHRDATRLLAGTPLEGPLRVVGRSVDPKAQARQRPPTATDGTPGNH